ncbi:MAG: hypothetical protein ACQGVC_22525 [Myxococcota bacterium]
MDADGDAIDPRRLAEAVRRACLEAAAAAYEDASLSGLCREGAWDVAVDAIRSLDVAALAADPAGKAPPAGAGLPRGGSAAAAGGALAAESVEAAAGLSEQRGPKEFTGRAHAIARRAAVLRASLADAARTRPGAAHDAAGAERSRATHSLLEIAMRCAQTTALAAELAARGHAEIRSEARVALQLARAATDGALALVEETLRPEEEERWAIDAKRQAWRVRLLLQRAAPFLQDVEPERASGG